MSGFDEQGNDDYSATSSRANPMISQYPYEGFSAMNAITSVNAAFSNFGRNIKFRHVGLPDLIIV
jgi:hypothetical protein